MLKTTDFNLSDGTVFPMVELRGIVSYQEYKELEASGWSTDPFHVDDSGNDYWDLSIYFCKIEDEEKAKKWCQENYC